MSKVCSRCEESKPVEEFHKENRRLDGLRPWCKPCGIEWRKAYNIKNKEKIEAKRKEYVAKNRERIASVRKAYYEANAEKKRAYAKEYNAKNRERVAARSKAHYEANIEKYRAYRRENKDRYNALSKAYNQKEHVKEKRSEILRRWREANIDKNRHKSAMYRAARIQRTPCWLTEYDRALIQRKYTLAQKKTESTGEMWVVDHILPLRGDFVSGLHVPSNLRVIKETTNSRKYNKYTPV